MRRRFWTADLHFGHANIREYEPARQELGADVDAMNDALIHRWNAVVGQDDEVYIVGDLCMGKIAESLPLVELLNGEKYLIAGNHDRWFGLYPHEGEDSKKGRMWARWAAAYQEVGLALITDEWLDVLIGRHVVRVCHFPYSGDHTEEVRYVENRPPDNGHVLLHGHVHGAWRINGRQINVGVDAHDYYPVVEEEIVQMIEEVKR